MYDAMQLQNYLPDLVTKQYGIPFNEELSSTGGGNTLTNQGGFPHPVVEVKTQLELEKVVVDDRVDYSPGEIPCMKSKAWRDLKAFKHES